MKKAYILVLCSIICSSIFAEAIVPQLVALESELIQLVSLLLLETVSDKEIAFFEKKYERLFKFIPSEYDKRSIVYFLKTENPIIPDKMADELALALNILLKPYKAYVSFSGGYNFISTPYFNGLRENEYRYVYQMYLGGEYRPPLADLLYLPKPKNNKDEEILKKRRDIAPDFYKIHLMPRSDDVVRVIMSIVQRAKDNKSFGDLINSVKYKNNPTLFIESNWTGEEQVFPVIVIYPAKGQDAAQQLLSRLLELFKGVEGIDITPRFNRKVTSLMYYAQGDADYKNESTAEFLDESTPNPGDEKWALFKPDLTGEVKDYSLKW